MGNKNIRVSDETHLQIRYYAKEYSITMEEASARLLEIAFNSIEYRDLYGRPINLREEAEMCYENTGMIITPHSEETYKEYLDRVKVDEGKLIPCWY